jgi:hypothetical protein
MIVLDDLLKDQKIDRIDIIKMDIQGAEGLAIAGLQETLKHSKSLAVFSEFWPWGLRQTGIDPLDFLRTFRDFGFSVSIINEGKCTVTEMSDFNAFIDDFCSTEYGSTQLRRCHTNLIFSRSR